MPNLSALEPFTTKALTLGNLILVTPQSVVGYQPNNPPNANGSDSTAAQPPSFIFNYEGKQSLVAESDITDHYVENNSSVQDQIALKPEIITTDGFIAELNDIVPELLRPLKIAADKLTVVAAYTPSLSATALVAYTTALFAYQVASSVVNSAVSTWNSIGNLITGSNGQTVVAADGTINRASSQNRQQVAFQTLYGYWRNRTLFTVQTPWAVFESMAVLKIEAVQDEETNTISNFKLTFKKIRKASTRTLSNDFSLSGRLNSQSASPTDLGTTPATNNSSLSSNLSSSGIA